MTETTQYLTGLGVTFLMSAAVVIYLRPHLRTILIELCGARERAAFWVAFSNVALCLSPLLFAIFYSPDRFEPGLPIRQLGAQIGAAIAGLLAAVVLLGIVIGRSIAKFPIAPGGHLSTATREIKGG